MSGSSIRAFQKFQDKYIRKLSILQTHTHAKRNSCSYKPSSEPNTCGFSDDSYPLWIYLMSCEYANSSYEYWHNSTANKTPVGSGLSPREGLGMRLKCILSVASQLAPARRVLWHHLEVGKLWLMFQLNAPVVIKSEEVWTKTTSFEQCTRCTQSNYSLNVG